MATPVEIDGTTLEGGGQLLRIALGVSALTEVPISFTKIRGNRPGGGGLKGQHLTCALWLAKACAAKLQGAGLKSKTLTFTPQSLQKELDFKISQSSPGAVGLVFQAVLPFILFSGQAGTVSMVITGGTNVSMSPSVDYVRQVLVPMLELIGIPRIKIECSRRGWSHGGSQIGSTQFELTPLPRDTTLKAFNLIERGDIVRIDATVIAPKPFLDLFEFILPRKIEDAFSAVEFGELQFDDSHNDKRFYLLLIATTSNGVKLGRDWLYNKRINLDRVEGVVSELVTSVIKELKAEVDHGGCVDEYMRDQLMVFQALAEGKSTVSGGRTAQGLVVPSLHARTAQWVLERLLGVSFDADGSCEGIGLRIGEEFVKRSSAENETTANEVASGIGSLQL